MKTVLYYFSGTGNTLAVARDLASRLGDTELIPIARALKGGAPGAYDAVGIIFPVYVFGLPLIVARFAAMVTVPKGAYLFAVADYGGLQGRALSLLRDILARRGIGLDAGFGLVMPGNYTPLYGAESDEKQKKIFAAAKHRTEEIAAAVVARRLGIEPERPLLLNILLYQLLYRLGAAGLAKEDKGFWTTDACIHCGLCGRICPVDNIEMRDGRPAWLHRCEQCMACLQWCPQEAIQFGKKTTGRRRYHHPDATAGDIAAQKG